MVGSGLYVRERRLWSETASKYASVMRHGLQQAAFGHQPGPDHFRLKPHISVVKLDQGRPPREGFGSISPKTWEPWGSKNYHLLFFV